MSSPADVDRQPLIQGSQDKPKVNIARWAAAVFAVAVLGLCSGTINLYPSLIDSFTSEFKFSSKMATTILTGGTMIMYITLPAGILLDKFGATFTLIISVALSTIPYIVLPYAKSSAVLFLIDYYLLATGNSGLFMTCLQIALSRSPPSIKGVSTSVVSSSLSIAFGVWFRVYGAGNNVIGNDKTHPLANGITFVSYIVTSLVLVASIAAYFLYRGFEPIPSGSSSTRALDVLKDSKLYLLLISSLLAVFDGLLVLSGGANVWKVFDPTYTSGPLDWSLPFSLTNCIFTIVLSALMEFLMQKFHSSRVRLFSLFWMILSLIPFTTLIAYSATSSHAFLGICLSCMGIAFGFGLAQIPALTGDIFGIEKVGFAFGIVQVGSIISAASTMPLINSLGRVGISVIVGIAGALHIITGGIWFYFSKGLLTMESLKRIDELLHAEN